jgi:TolA-binding protein
MPVNNPGQGEPLIEGRADLRISITWFRFVAELVRQHNKLQATVTEQQTQIDDLISRVEALESP